MSEKKCPACGVELAENAAKCPICGLTGLDQVFLSEEAYNAWVEHVLVPHSFSNGGKGLKRTQSSTLLLLDKGDLYAMGDNYSGIFGPEQPQVLLEPRRIARKIKSAVLTQKHTLMLHWDGRVEILGNSALAERFAWEHRAAKVYAHRSLEAFLLEDEEGKRYFFGDNSMEHIPIKKEILMTLPPRKEEVHRSYHLLRRYYELVYTSGGYSNEYLIAGSTWGTDITSFDESVQKKGWYRALLCEYGECNISIDRKILLDKTKVTTNHDLIGHCEITAQQLDRIGSKMLYHYGSDSYSEWDRPWEGKRYSSVYQLKNEHIKGSNAVEMAHIQVIKRDIVLQNRMIFVPMLCEKKLTFDGDFFDLCAEEQ